MLTAPPILLSLCLVAGLFLAGCGRLESGGGGDDGGLPSIGEAPTPPSAEPEHITVDHILIGVKSQRFPQGRNTAEAAKLLAYQVLSKLQAGADWAPLKKQHSEDPPPGGPYDMANDGIPSLHPKEAPRRGMVAAFGDVGFALPVGGIWLAEYDKQKSPFGYHVIKRVK